MILPLPVKDFCKKWLPLDLYETWFAYRISIPKALNTCIPVWDYYNSIWIYQVGDEAEKDNTFSFETVFNQTKKSTQLNEV